MRERCGVVSLAARVVYAAYRVYLYRGQMRDRVYTSVTRHTDCISRVHPTVARSPSRRRHALAAGLPCLCSLCAYTLCDGGRARAAQAYGSPLLGSLRVWGRSSSSTADNHGGGEGDGGGEGRWGGRIGVEQGR